jgi:hypothetical protein
MKLTGAAILVPRGIKVLRAAPAAYPYRSTTLVLKRFSRMNIVSRKRRWFVISALAILLFGVGAGPAICIVYVNFSGTIQKIEGGKVTFKCARPNPDQITIRIDKGTRITLDGKKVTVKELKTGHTARAVILNGLVTTIEAKTR